MKGAEQHVLENRERICFTTACPTCLSRVVITADFGCHSSSCTVVMEQLGSVRFYTSTIRLYTRAIGYDPAALAGLDGYACTADCGGMGELRFYLNELPSDTYTVKLGETILGEISIPLHLSPAGQHCFDLSAPAAIATPLLSPLYASPLEPPE